VSSLIKQTPIIPLSFTSSSDLVDIKDKPIPDQVLAKAASKLHITMSQVATAFDIWKLCELEKSIQDTVGSAVSLTATNQVIATMEATFKSVLKRRLLKTLRGSQDDELSFNSLDSGEQRNHLEKCFNGTIIRYRSILK